jgi:hypothetical protein
VTEADGERKPTEDRRSEAGSFLDDEQHREDRDHQREDRKPAADTHALIVIWTPPGAGRLGNHQKQITIKTMPALLADGRGSPHRCSRPRSVGGPLPIPGHGRTGGRWSWVTIRAPMRGDRHVGLAHTMSQWIGLVSSSRWS